MKHNYLYILFAGFVLSACVNKAYEEPETTANGVEAPPLSSVTFKVDDVQPAPSLLHVDSLRKLFAAKITYKVLFLPEEQKNDLYVPCRNNALIQTVHECYANHRPLVLSPDVIWLAICQGISIHVNQKFDSLETKLFKKNKPKQLVVRNDSLGMGAKHWKDFIADISGLTRKYTKGDFYSYVVANHSTTTSIERTAFQVTLLETYKKAFTYVGKSGCGIPAITLRGTKQDWMKIRKQLSGLDSIGLGEWHKGLEPVLDEFVNVYDNKIDTAFWRDIYKDRVEYFASGTSGWIIKFFPYVKTLEFNNAENEMRDDGSTRAEEVYQKNEYISGSRYLESRLSTDDFPSGVSKADVTWNNYLDPNKPETKQLMLCSGFFGMKQNKNKSLEPLISWAVLDKGVKIKGGWAPPVKELELKHRSQYWSPEILEEPKIKAIYNSKKNKSAADGNIYIERLLEDSIAQIPPYKGRGMGPVKIRLVVFSNGKAGNVKVSGTSDAKLKAWIAGKIETLPEKWFPALDQPRGDFAEEPDSTIKVKVNSIVNLTLFKE
jgi:hypothetical protein